MLSTSHPLTREEIRQLSTRYPDQHVRVQTPELDRAGFFDDDSTERQAADGIRTAIAECFQFICNQLKARGYLTPSDFQYVEDSVYSVTDFFKGSPAIAPLVGAVSSVDDYLAERAGNIFLYSMMLGSRCLDYVARERRRQTHARDVSTATYEDLTSLGLGSVLMDIAMVPLQKVYLSDEPLSKEMLQKIQRHPIDGLNMLPMNMPATARVVVRTHHENMDGSGYPEGTDGSHQHVFTRIVRVVDSFEAATAGRVYQDARSPARVLWEMTQGRFSELYDARLTCSLVSLIQPFPIGTKIVLHDGREAIVAKYNREDPLAPWVIVAYDASGRQYPLDRIRGPVRLCSGPDTHVATCDGEDITFLNHPRKEVFVEEKKGIVSPGSTCPVP